MDDPKNILLKILEIIGYQDNKEEFADEFLKNIYFQSVQNLAQSLPQDQQQLKEKLAQAKTPEELEALIKSSFTEDRANEALKDSAQTAIQKYITIVEPTLSSEQKQNLQSYLDSLT